jgi:hypothetical protein
MVPVALGGLALAATIFGLPLGIALWVVVVVVFRDVDALLRGQRAESRRLESLCQAMALLGGLTIGVLVVAGFDDLISGAANVVSLAVGVVWVLVVARGAQAATAGSPSRT